MASIVILAVALILHSFYGSCNFALARINISKEGDFDEFGRILHKPLILKKTTQVEDGGDCVDINKQPALNHPLLTNHNIQSKPSKFRNFVPQPSSTTWLTGKSCPDGMVPIQRTPKKDYILSLTSVLNASLNANLDSKNANSIHRKAVYLRMNGGPKKYGVYGYVSTYNLNVTKDQTSTANIWIYSGPSTRLSSLSAGWMVSPSMFGDKRARLFIHWTGDGHYKTGCYNTQCPGFVQVHKRVTPGFVLPKTSTYGGQQYALRIQIFQDHKTGNWWLGVSELDIFVGYWPKELLPHLSDGSDNVGWGGTAWAGKDGIYPPMGSGHLPDGDYTHACYFRNVSYEDDIHQLHHPFPDQTEDSNNNKAGCYGFKNYHTSKGNLGYSFTFGGPGGKCD